MFGYRLSYHVLLICSVAILLRAIWVSFVPVIPLSDSQAYDVFAQNIANWGVYGWKPDEPTSYWPVGTSAIYALLYFIFGHTYWPIVVFNILCSLSCIMYTSLLCKRYFEEIEVGTYTILLISIWPTLIYFSTVLASELPYMAFLLAGFYHLTSERNEFIKAGLISGALFCIAYYIRPLAIVPFCIAFFVLILQRKIDKGHLIGRFFIASLVLALLVAPWAYRNYGLYNEFVPMSTNGGATLWMGNQPNTNGGYMPLPDSVSDIDEYTRNEYLKNEAIEYIKSDPVSFIGRTFLKFVQFHTRETIGVTWNEQGIKSRLGEKSVVPLKIIGQVFWSIVLLLSCLGILYHIKVNGFFRTALHPFILIWLSTAGVHAIIVSQDRYHIPIIPFVAAFSAYFIHRSRVSIQNWRKSR